MQVLESEVRASKNAEECPYPVDECCPNPGTWPGGDRSTHSENDEDPGHALFRMESTGRAQRLETNRTRWAAR
jgi:hypothetical protein